MLPSIAANLTSEFIVVVLGILFVQFVRNRWDQRRYGRWQVVLKQGGVITHRRNVSVAKTKQVHEMPEELSVFLKGVVSGHVWLNCDLVTEGKACGMLVEDASTRQWIIDLDKNPPAKSNEKTPQG